ncbi:MAG: alpha/beta hydrolase domain-containing protein [Steroidobacteraceae bacterium]
MITRREAMMGVLGGMTIGLPTVRAVAAASDSKPRAIVSGPVQGGAHGWAFGGTPRSLDELGYVEREYFISGTATRFRAVGETGADGRWSIEPNGQAPFKTRFLVRTPKDAGKFNGTVIVCWNNVTAGYDIAQDTRGAFDGFAFVAVSAQAAAIEGFARDPHGLKSWDPQRYGDLSIPGDAYSYDVLTQVARAVGPDRSKSKVDPLGGLQVKRLIATGGSQSAGRLTTYINAVHPRERVFDAFMPTISFGRAAGIDANAIIDSSMLDKMKPEEVRAMSTGNVRIRDDLSTPVMIVNSETETLFYLPSVQPDTDTFRYWEVAGASHAPGPLLAVAAEVMKRDGMQRPVGTMAGVPSQVDWTLAFDAALHHVQRWLTEGKAPPVQPRIEVFGSPPRIARDRFGNAVGGVRLPDLEVPTASYFSEMAQIGMAGLTGTTTPLSPELVKSLYPTRDAYVAKIQAAADKAVKAGVLLPRDAQAYVAAARDRPFA